MKKKLTIVFCLCSAVALCFYFNNAGNSTQSKKLQLQSAHYLDISSLEMDNLQSEGTVHVFIGAVSLQDGKIGFLRTSASKLLLISDFEVTCELKANKVHLGELLESTFRKAGLSSGEGDANILKVQIKNISLNIEYCDGVQIKVSAPSAVLNSSRYLRFSNAQISKNHVLLNKGELEIDFSKSDLDLDL